MFKTIIALCLTSISMAQADDFRVGLILDKGGKDDKSFNAAGYEGVNRAKKELGIQFKYVEAMDDAGIESTMRSFAQKKFDIIVAIGFAMADPMKKVAPLFPDSKFAIVDAEVPGANVRSLLFEEHQGSYLMGAIAAIASKAGAIGFLGGMDVPLIRRFQMGYEAGAKKVNPKIKIITNYIGVTSEAWNNPAKGKELALSQFNQGADVIFAAAGASNYGLFDAAQDKKKLAIGVDSNQNWVKPGFVLTSMLKRIDLAVFDAIKDTKEKKFLGGVRRFGLADHGVDYALDKYNEKIFTPEMKKRADQIKAEIISGKIQVPDYYKNGKK